MTQQAPSGSTGSSAAAFKDTIFDLTDQVVVITGGGGVLGGTIASYLAGHGARIAVLDLREELAERRAEMLRAEGGEAIAFAADVLSRERLVEVRDAILDKWGRIDALLNAAGGNMPGATVGPDQDLFELSADDFKKVTDLNLTGSVLPTIVFAEKMTLNGRGSIINFSSMTAQRAVTRVAGYSAAKGAIDSITRWMAAELSLRYGEGIRVNAIAPGFFIGDQNRRLLLNEDGSPTERGDKVIRQTPMGRFGRAEELCGTIHWLLTDASSFVTGVVVPIDGGFSMFSGV